MDVWHVTHQLELFFCDIRFLHAGIGSKDFFLTEVLCFHEPPMSPIVGVSDIDQVYIAKSSIHLKYVYLLKASVEYFPFVTTEKSTRNL